MNKLSTIRIGNTLVTLGETGPYVEGYEYKSLLANQPTPPRLRFTRKGRTPRLFKGHRP